MTWIMPGRRGGQFPSPGRVLGGLFRVHHDTILLTGQQTGSNMSKRIRMSSDRIGTGSAGVVKFHFASLQEQLLTVNLR